MHLELGWHVVKSRSFSMRNQSDAERDESQRHFFHTGVLETVPHINVGIDTLRTKLSKVLLRQIRKELPSPITAIEEALGETELSLKELGNPRDGKEQQRAYLTEKSIDFPETYYFRPWWSLRLSSNAIEIYDAKFDDPENISRANFLEDHVGLHIRQSRLSGLPSLVNLWVIGEVFRQQSLRWEKIARHHVQQVFLAVKGYVELCLSSLMDVRTFNMLVLKQIRPELNKKQTFLEAKLEELLTPYERLDPITYDPSFINEIEEIRSRRYSEGSSSGVSIQGNTVKQSDVPGRQLLTESIDGFTNSEILDLIQTYYKKAISVFINNVAVLAIENCLVADLAAIFSPLLISSMDEEKLHAIAAESDEVRSQRTMLKQKLEDLRAGKRILDVEACNSGTQALRFASRTRRTASHARSSVDVQSSRPQTPLHQHEANDTCSAGQTSPHSNITSFQSPQCR
ncbi:hypothetical protein K469DRAFT_686203 [Zopfia rhizophila CBS 207.26]|uniref:GED domain-containing protein n=1 Tax=Zopfia rhizophila CBS 207.26 TaxID=1314779 RepID=A0A6A6EAX1_9PEZI|nr:hypothetical protein K469DRAFT_686203 [Zopfia rhizophila CBS 207.26]